MPCSTKSPCIQGPLANLSVETPELLTYLGLSFGSGNIDPPLGSDFIAGSCLGACVSTISQADADQCAYNQDATCILQNINPPGTGPGTGVAGGSPVFYNVQQQVSITCPDGSVFTWTVAPGYIAGPDQDGVNSQAASIALAMARQNQICLSSLSTSDFCQYDTISQTITASCAATSVTFAVDSGTLPTGVTLSQTGKLTAELTGSANQAGSFTFGIRVTSGNGAFMVKSYTVTVLGISNIDGLPAATENVPYSYQLVGDGGTAPYSFSMFSGGLPSGLSLSSGGLISGTPAYGSAVPGGYPISVQVKDAVGKICVVSATLQDNLAPGPNWLDLNWSQYQLNPNGAGNTVTGSASANTANGDLKSVGQIVSITPAKASGVVYTGGAVTARMKVVVTSSVSGYTTLMRVVGSIHGIIGSLNLVNNASGTYTADFAIPATTNETFTIDDASPGNRWALIPNATPGELSFTWQIFNL